MFPTFLDFFRVFLESEQVNSENKSEDIEYLETADGYVIKLRKNQGSKKENFRIIQIYRKDKGKVPETINFVEDTNQKNRKRAEKYGIEGGDEIRVENLIGGLIYKNFYIYYENIKKCNLDYILSRVYENYYTWNINREFSKSDLFTLKELENMMNTDIIVVEEGSDDVEFPILNKTEKVKRFDKDNRQLFGNELSVNLLYELKTKTNDQIGKYLGFDGNSEQVEENPKSLQEDDEDSENLGNNEKNVGWKQKEENINDALNIIFSKRKTNYHSEQRGGGLESDILVKTGDDNKNGFFVEAKNNYKTAHYLKFSLIYDGNNIKLKDSQADDEQEFSRTGEYEKHFHQMMKSIQEDKIVKDSFETLKVNVQKCIKDMQKIESVSKRLKFDAKTAVKFPEGFAELAKVFNFYIKEWIKKYLVLKSEMIYRISKNDLNNFDDLESEIKKINENISRVLSKSKRKNIQDLNEFDKFKYMYQMFISGDKNKNMSIDDQEYNYRLFTFDSSFDSSENKGLTKKIIENIIEYYSKVKKCAYIEVENDVYRMFDDYEKLENPEPIIYFEEKILTDEFSNKILTLDNFRNCGVNVCVTVKNATKLKLEILFRRPENLKEQNGVSFEQISKDM